MTTVTATADIAPLGHAEAIALAGEEYRRFAALAASVRDDQWALPTDCTGWTVRDLVGHLVGAERSAASVREMASQQLEVARRVRRLGGQAVDHMTAIQIERTADLSEQALVAECAALAPRAARGRGRTPAPVRRFVSIPVEAGPIRERWTMGYFVDVILTRDTWMHRVDLSRALGVEMATDADHDGRIVADIVAEWGRRHGQPFRLHLDGPAGGDFTSGDDGESHTLDAVEFCRIVSGRATGTGLLGQAVPF